MSGKRTRERYFASSVTAHAVPPSPKEKALERKTACREYRQAAELILLFAIQVSLSAVDIVDQRSSIEFHILICVIRVIITTLRIP